MNFILLWSTLIVAAIGFIGWSFNEPPRRLLWYVLLAYSGCTAGWMFVIMVRAGYQFDAIAGYFSFVALLIELLVVRLCWREINS